MDCWCTPVMTAFATPVLTMFSSMDQDRGDKHNRSDRERRVLQLLVAGCSYKMIAAQMFIALDRVRSPIKKSDEKLHVNSKSEAVANALRFRIV